MAQQICIFDTTLRDGEQSPGCSMTPGEKLRLARQLDGLGVDVIEGGFPIASEGDFEAVRWISSQVRRPVIAALARALPGDIDRAWEAVAHAERPRLHVFLATSDIHLRHKLKITREECLRQATRGIAQARQYCADVEFSAEDATRSDLAFLCDVAEAVVDAGATTVNLPDTVGYAVPSDMARIVNAVKDRIGGGAVISAHCHNDLGLAVANSIAAVEAGARQVECTINGIGERAGNASLEEFVMALHVRQDALPFVTGVHTRQIFAASCLLSGITGVAVQPNKAVVGRNAFAHEAGIHQDGVIKNPLTYEIMTPESVGAPESRLVLGKHSGRHALQLRYEGLGYQFNRRDLDQLYRRFVALADRLKVVEDVHLHAIAQEEVTQQAHSDGTCAVAARAATTA